MATRSMIALQTQKGENSFRIIYAHYDGNPPYRYPLLKEHYSSNKKAQELLDLGDVYSLGSHLPNEIDMTNIYNYKLGWYDKTKKSTTKFGRNPHGHMKRGDITTYYAMEDDLEDHQASENLTFEEVIDFIDVIWHEYIYLGVIDDYGVVNWVWFDSYDLERVMSQERERLKFEKNLKRIEHNKEQERIRKRDAHVWDDSILF